MTRRIVFTLLGAAAVFAADDPWARLRAVKSGSELRIYRKDAKQPVLAKMDELTDENLLIVVKNAQVAIPRAAIDRVDARPPGGRKITRETTVKNDAQMAANAGVRHSAASSSTASGVSIGSKPEFETVYRRPSPAPKK